MQADTDAVWPGCGGSKARCEGCSAWSTRTRTASTSSRRSPPRTGPCRRVALELLDAHLEHCVRDAIDGGGPEADAKIAEASAAIARLVKS